MITDQLQSFYCQRLLMKRDSIKGTLQAALSSFQKDLHSETISHLQCLSHQALQNNQFSTLLTFCRQNTKKLWSLIRWMKEKAVRPFNNKTTQMVVLILILLNKGAQNIHNSYKYQKKYFQVRSKNIEKLLMNEKTELQIFQQQLFLNFSGEQMREMFRQLGEILQKEDMQLAIQLYYVYYQIDLSNESKSLLGESLIKAGEIVKGLKYLRQINYKQYGLQGLFKLAKIYFYLRDFKESVKTYLQMIRLDNGSVLTTKSHFQIGAIYQTMVLHSQAIKRYRQSLKFNLKRSDEERELYWTAISRIAYICAYNQNHHSSVSILSKMIQQENIPFSFQAKAIQSIGRSLFILKNFEKSLYYYQKLQGLLQDKLMKPSSNCLEENIQIFINLKNYDKAKQYIHKLLQIEQSKCMGYVYLSYVEFRLGSLNSSKAHLTYAENIDTNKTLTSEYYVQIIEGIYGNNDISRGYIQNAKAEQSTLAGKYEQLASQSRKSLRCDQSLLYLRQSLRYNDQPRASVYFQVGFSLTISQRFLEAITSLKQAINLDEKHEDALQLLFGIHHDLNHKEQMMECLKKLEKINSSKAKRLLNLVKFQYQQKEREEYTIDGVNLCLLPSRSKKDAYLDVLHRAIGNYELGSRMEAYQILAALFKDIFDEGEKLYNCAYYLAQCNLLDLALIFCKRYFILQPFNIDNFIKYIKLFPPKGQLTLQHHNHLRLFKDYVDKDDEAHFQLAKIALKLKDYNRCIVYMKTAIQLSMREEYYVFMQKVMAKIKLEGEDMLKKMNTIRSDYWKVYQRLAKIYRRQQNQDLQVYNLQQAIKYTWKKEKCLMRLCDIFRASPEKYFSYARQLVAIQTTNVSLLMELADIYGSRGMNLLQIGTYNQVLRVDPSKEGLFEKMEKIVVKISKIKDGTGTIFYQRLLDAQNQTNCFVLCFLHKHFNRISQSFSYFLLGIQEIYSRNKPSPNEAKRKLAQIRSWFYQSKDNLDNDSKLKKLILQHHLGEQDREEYTKLLREALCLGSTVTENRLKDCTDNLERFWQGYLCYYSNEQIGQIVGLVLSELERKTPSAVQTLKRFISSQYPEIKL